MMRLVDASAAVLSAVFAGQGAMAEPVKPFLSPAFGSHMVLQREKPTTFFGWTKPGSVVTVTLDGQRVQTAAGADGRWAVRVMPPKAGGPYTVIVDGPERRELTDVLVGDVWLCCGQSNMEFGVGVEKDGAKEAAAADLPGIRLYTASRQVALHPRQVNGGEWLVCSPKTITQGGWSGFSAVGYHFGKKLHQELGVPIGLMSVNWGGTTAEAWTSAGTLAPLGDFGSGLALVESMVKENSPAYGCYLDLWLGRNDAGSRPGGDWQRVDLDDSGWTMADASKGFEAVGMGQQDGVVWFRKTITLPDPLPAKGAGATLNLGPIHQMDHTWINGQPAGSSGWGPWPRSYGLWEGLLKPGKNVIAIRVIANGQQRGFEPQAKDITLRLADGALVPLGEGWKVHAGAKVSKENPGPASYDMYPNLPTVLFNGMLSPHVVQGIRGAIWYQGESNAGRAWQYRTLLPAMIADWRRAFGQGDFPFYIVSLAAYQAHRDQPGEDEWAELREAQALTAATVPNSGLAVAIDVGDAVDIHPANKKPVGERLALVALAKEYGKQVSYSGPVYRQSKREGATIRLSFDHADGGLKVKGEKLGEFAVAGADRKWHWAEARIEGDEVVVSSPEVAQPVAVRYAWQINPVATLVNGAGLPAVPFRTDDWPAVTKGRK